MVVLRAEVGEASAAVRPVVTSLLAVEAMRSEAVAAVQLPRRLECGPGVVRASHTNFFFAVRAWNARSFPF